MYEGGTVESLVSNTTYNFEKLQDRFRLCAEGIPVDLSYLTKDEERRKLMDETFKRVKNKRKFDKEIRAITEY